MSQALEQLTLLGGEPVRYLPRVGSPKSIMALVDPIRRTDDLGNQSFLTKTYELWIVRGTPDGIESVAANADSVMLKLQPTDQTETTLTITKIYPERDFGIPGDGVGMWHLEAVA